MIVGGRIYTPFPIPTDWSGAIFERGVIAGTEWPDDNDVVQQIDPGVLLQMLAARGESWSRERFDATVSRYLNAAEAWARLTDESLFSFQMRQMMDSKGWFGFEKPTDEKLAAARELGSARREADSISRCIRTYSRVVTASLQRDALSSLPIPAIGETPLTLGAVGTGDQIAILNVVCRQLRRTPRAATLSETIRLAETAEAVALRQKLTTWAETLRAGDGRMDIVLRDVEYAKKELGIAKSLADASTIYTAVALPVLAVSHIAPIIAGALGATVTIGGVLVTALGYDLQRRNRWAMFASDVPSSA